MSALGPPAHPRPAEQEETCTAPDLGWAHLPLTCCFWPTRAPGSIPAQAVLPTFPGAQDQSRAIVWGAVMWGAVASVCLRLRPPEPASLPESVCPQAPHPRHDAGSHLPVCLFLCVCCLSCKLKYTTGHTIPQRSPGVSIYSCAKSHTVYFLPSPLSAHAGGSLQEIVNDEK